MKRDQHKLPNMVIGFRCSDKVSQKETWDDPIRKLDIAQFPSPFRAVLIGEPSCGKSALALNFIVHNNFEEVYVVHQNELTTEYDNLDPTQVLNEVPPLEFWREMDPSVKRCCIIDDLEYTSATKERCKNLALMFRYVSSHCNLSIILCHQSWFDTPRIVKKMCNIVCIWKIRSRQEVSMIENRCNLDTGMLGHLFSTVAKNFHDSICLDFTTGTPYPIRVNLFSPIVFSD